MTCSSCVHRLEEALSAHDEVTNVRVSLVSRTAIVSSTLSDPAPLIATVQSAGFGASLDKQAADPEDELREYRKRLVVAAFCSVYVLIFSLALPTTHLTLIAAGVFATPVQLW